MSRASIRSLRYYEEIGAFFPAYVDPDTKYRYYSVNQIYELNLVRLCIEEGMDVKDVHDYYSEGDVLEAVNLFRQCEELASKRLKKAQATMQRMEAYTKEYERQLRANIADQKTELPVRLLAIRPIAKATESIWYRDYLNSLTFCISEARRENYITLAQQGVMISEDNWWCAYLEVAPSEDINPTGRDDFYFSYRDAQRCKVKSMFGSDVERVFQDSCNIRNEGKLLCVQEAWAYGAVVGVPAFDVYLKR